MGKGSKFTAKDVARIICEAKRDSGATEREIIDLCPCWQDPTPTAGLPPPAIRGVSSRNILEMRFYGNNGNVSYCAGRAWRANNDGLSTSQLLPLPMQNGWASLIYPAQAWCQADVPNSSPVSLWRPDETDQPNFQNSNRWPWSIVLVGSIPPFSHFGWKCTVNTDRDPRDFDLILDGSLILAVRGSSAVANTYRWWRTTARR